MNGEPPTKRAVAFLDGPNLFHTREAFGYTYPNNDVSALFGMDCERQGWKLARVCLCPGLPDVGDNPNWHFFRTHMLATMGRQGIVV